MLTKLPGVPDKSDVLAGMAYFANTGPSEKTCGDCTHRGYYRMSGAGKSYYTTACAVFRKLTGKYGPRVGKTYNSCKYFAQKTKR